MGRTVRIDDLRVGMFVQRIEKSWIEHPFWRSRFTISSLEDIETIRATGVRSVVIDEERSVVRSGGSETTNAQPPLRRHSFLASQSARSFADEKPAASKLIRRGVKEMRALFARAHRGEGVSIEAFSDLTHDVMASIERNPHALIALTRLKHRDEYTYVHSLAVSALSISFARTMGLSERVVFEMGLGGLLHDIGKTTLPDALLNKAGPLDEHEFATVRTHPETGYMLLKLHSAMPQLVLDICRYHHERIDGTGYPRKLSGDLLSREVRMAAICDVYDAVTSKRPYKTAWTPVEGITRMTEWVGHLDQTLLFHFMKVIGVYPPGILVRLRSNRLGVTMPNGRRASRPKVRAFYSAREIEQMPYEDIVIGEDLAHDQIMGREYPLDWGMVGWPILVEQIMRGEDVTIAAGAPSRQARSD